MAKHEQIKHGPDAVLTAREAAKYLRLALPTFYRYMWKARFRFQDRRTLSIQ